MIGWGTFVLEWAAHRSADTLLEPLTNAFRQDPLVKNMTAAVQRWMESLPADAQIASCEPIFPSRLADSELGDRPRLFTIRQMLHRKEIPSEDVWAAALMEQWEFVTLTVGSRYGIFAMPRDAAHRYLKDLARELALTCASDEDRFKRFVYSTIEQLAKKHGGAF